MQRLVHPRDAVIGAINRQAVLDQIVGADAEEVRFVSKQIDRQRCRRHFDHDADRHRWRRDAALFQRLDRVRHGLPRESELLHARHEGEHDPQRPVHGGAEQRAELRLKHFFERQAQPQSAEAKRRAVAAA